MRSKQRIFALLLTLVMIVGITTNQHVIVVNAEAAGIETLIGTVAVQDISAGGTFSGSFSEERYSYVNASGEVTYSKGKLVMLTVGAGENYLIEPLENTEALSYMYSDNKLNYSNIYSANWAQEIANSSESDVTYYLWLVNYAKDTYSIKIDKVDSITTLIDEAVDVSKYDTYSGELEEKQYIYPMANTNSIGTGKLLKFTLEPDEMIHFKPEECHGYVYTYNDDKLEYYKYCGMDSVIANTSDVKTTYYYWIENYNGENNYKVTTSQPIELSDACDKAAKLGSGDVELTNNSNCLTSFWNLSRYYDASSNAGYYVAEKFNGYLFCYDVPAMTQTTIKYPADSTIKNNARTYIYDDAENANFYGILKAPGDSHLVTNATDTTKRVYVFVNDYEMSSNSNAIDINITDTSIAAEEGKVVLYGYNDSWNQILEKFLKDNPSYEDKFQFVQLSLSGEWYVDMVEDALTLNSKGTAIIGLDLDYLSDAMDRGLLDPVEDIEFDMDSYDNAYDYTIELAETEEGTLGVAYSVSPGGFAYNTAIASEVLGTSNPDEISAMLDTPVEFLQVAEKMKAKGYYMTSGIDILSLYMADRTFNSAETIAFREAIIENGYTTGNQVWSTGWTNDMTSGKVFGFFGTNWFMQYVFQYSDDITMDLCTGPLNYPWGGEFFGISTDGSNPEGDEAARAFLEYFCCNEEAMYELAVERKDIVPNNKNVVAKIIENGVCNDSKLSRHPFIVWNESASKVMLGDWESKCVDGKYIICVDENNQIDLANDGRLALAGFKYSNFSKVTSNGTISKDGVLTVDNLDEVVKYEYVETGDLSGVSVTCYLQFIACDVSEDELDTVTKLVSEGEPVKKANGETVTGWVQVTNGKIAGQIDEISVETKDKSTSINITENRDATGQVVMDATLNVGQEKISEETLNQSIDVAVNKTNEYKQEEENTAQIVEIKAEFNDDSANTELSKDFFNRLGDNGISLEITKKVNGEFEYMWYFNKDSINGMDKKELKDVDTKLTIHKDKSYADQKDVDKITKEGSVNCVLEFDHEGKLPGETTVTANVGNKYKDGETVYYYHYDPRTNTLTYVGQTKVDGGCASVKLKHCSDYVITNEFVSNNNAGNQSSNPDSTTEVTTEANGGNVDSPTTGDNVPVNGLVLLMIISCMGIGVLVKKRVSE